MVNRMRSSTPAWTRREFLRLGGAGIGALALLPAWQFLPASTGKPSEPELDVKIGEMILAGFRGYALSDKNPIMADLKDRYVGGVVLFDYDVAYGKYKRNIKSPEQLAALDEAGPVSAHSGADRSVARATRSNPNRHRTIERFMARPSQGASTGATAAPQRDNPENNRLATRKQAGVYS